MKAGRSVAQVSFEPGVSDQTIYDYREQNLIDSGLKPGVTSTDNTELIAAKRRIKEVESELAIQRRAAELLKAAVPPKALRGLAVKASEGHSVQARCRLGFD